MAGKGRSILIKKSDGLSPATFTTVGGIRSKTLTIANETADKTTDDDVPWRMLEGDVGLRTVSLSGSGVFKDDAIIKDIENDAVTGDTNEYQIVFENGDIVQGVFQVTSFEHTGEHVGPQEFSISMESADSCTMTRA